MPVAPQVPNNPVDVTGTFEEAENNLVFEPDSEDLSEVATIAQNAELTANGKNRVYRQTTPPTGGTYVEGDLWFDTDAGNLLHTWNGTNWVSVQDAAIAAAQQAAVAAQFTADGKNRVFRQSTQPTGGVYTEGDLWFNTANDNSFSRFTGGSWQPFTIGNNAIASLSASKLTAGTIDANVITVSNINAGNITSGTLNAAVVNVANLSANNITGGTLNGAVVNVQNLNASAITSGVLTGVSINTSLNVSSTGIVSGNFLIANASLTCNGFGIFNGHTSFESFLTANGAVTAPGIRDLTTSAASNVRINTDSGLLLRSTASSERFKQDITPIDQAPDDLSPDRLLEVPVRAFRYRPGYVNSEDVRATAVVPGFIAEELEQVYPIAVDYDDEGLPADWNFRFIVPGLLALIQRQQQQISALEARVTTLENAS